MEARGCGQKFRKPAWLAALLVVFLLCGPGHGLARELKKATLLPQWEPQAQFAGLYMAEDKGLYREHGVDLTILCGCAEHPSHMALAMGEVDFATMFLSTALKLASQGDEVLNLTQIVQRSSLLLVAKKQLGIERPEDLNGRRISLWGPEFSWQIESFVRRHGLRVETLPQGNGVNLFLRGGVAAASAMRYNEYHTIINSGLDEDELTVFSMADYGLSFPEDGLYCLRSTWERDPGLACAVALATMEGWRLAFAHPEEALDAVMRRVEQAKLPTNRVHQRWMLRHMREIIAPRLDTREDGGESLYTGTLSREDFMAVAKAMKKFELIGSIPDYEDFHVTCRAEP